MTIKISNYVDSLYIKVDDNPVIYIDKEESDFSELVEVFKYLGIECEYEDCY